MYGSCTRTVTRGLEEKKGGGVLELFEMDWKKEGVARDVSPYMVMF